MGIVQIEYHATGIGLVRNVGRIDLHRHGEAQLLCDQQGLAGRVRDHGVCHRNMEGGQQCLGFHLGQHFAMFLHRAFDDEARAFHIRFDVVRERAGHLHQQLLVAVVGVQVREHFDCRFRCTEVRAVCFGKGFARLGDLSLAHPAGQ